MNEDQLVFNIYIRAKVLNEANEHSYFMIQDDSDVTGGYRLLVRDHLEHGEEFDYWFEDLDCLLTHIIANYCEVEWGFDQ